MPLESLEGDIQTLLSSNCVTPEVVQRFCTTLTGLRDASVVDTGPISEWADLGAVGSFAIASFLRESRFTTSEILLQRLASKQCWTESELSEPIDLLKSRHFRVGDIGLDLTRKVRRSYSISYNFILFHTISYYFIPFHRSRGCWNIQSLSKYLCVNTEMVTKTLICTWEIRCKSSKN